MKILIIEDSKTEAQIFCQTLKRIMDQPLQIYHRMTLREGVDTLEEQGSELDLVFLDLKLPDSADGRKTYEAIAPYAHIVPVIIMSGDTDEQIMREVLQNGAADYIVKGGKKRQVDLLKETIDFALCRHAQIRALVTRTEQDKQCVHWLSGGYSAGQ